MAVFLYPNVYISNNCFCKGETDFVNACGPIRKRGHPVSPASLDRMLGVLLIEHGAVIGTGSCCVDGSAVLLTMGPGGNCLYNLVMVHISMYS